jgi:hypothetical protein
MQHFQSTERTCDAKACHGGGCRRPAGWGTSHRGRAPCRLHGGCLPNVVARYEQQAALDFAINALGAEVDDEPLEAMLQAVRLASGTVAYWRRRVHGVEEPSETLTQGYERAILNLSRVAKAAVDAGVAERQVSLVARAAEEIALAAEEALATLPLSVAERTLFASAFGQVLARLEGAAHGVTRWRTVSTGA